MPVERKPIRAVSAVVSRGERSRLSAPSSLRPAAQAVVGKRAWSDNHMPNGDPPNLMLWGDAE